MRKLATIRRIKSLIPIKGADVIELAIIDGWQCIVKKDEFKVDDLCVYFEIDSFLPEDERYSFLGTLKTHQGKQGYRIRTMKMRGAISQGLALPLSMYNDLGQDYSLGEDVSIPLNVTKYDTEINMNGSVSSNTQSASAFPPFLRKTDQERIQNLTTYFDIYQGVIFEETLKLDGSSMTIYNNEVKLPWYKSLVNKVHPYFSTTQFGVCSRNINLKEVKGNAFWDMANKLEAQTCIPPGYAVQGELVGPKIQSNHEKVESNEFYVFDIFNIKEQRYLNPLERADMMAGSLQKLKHVPIISTVKILSECTLDTLLQRVQGQSINKSTVSEGRVYKAMTKPSLTFKCISNKYLLKEK